MNNESSVHDNPYLAATWSIPAGETRSYRDLAALAGRPAAARAAGRAIGACPLDAPHPWHRVVSSEGALSRDPARANVQLQRLRAEDARPLERESNAAFLARTRRPVLGSWKSRRFVDAHDPRVEKFPPHAVEAFASAAAARERGFHAIDDEPTARASAAPPSTAGTEGDAARSTSGLELTAPIVAVRQRKGPDARDATSGPDRE